MVLAYSPTLRKLERAVRDDGRSSGDQNAQFKDYPTF